MVRENTLRWRGWRNVSEREERGKRLFAHVRTCVGERLADLKMLLFYVDVGDGDRHITIWLHIKSP